MSWLIPKIAHWTQPNFYALANNQGKIQLLTLGFSHYVEIARWSLQLKGIKFVEHAYVPGQHILPVLAARVCGEALLLSDSSYVTPVGDRKKGVEDTSKEAKRAKSSRSTAVPLAIIPNSKEALADSWSIAKYSGLAPIENDFKILLDTKLGPLSRQLAYSYILKQKSWFSELCSVNQPWWWRMLWGLFVGGYVLKLLEKIFRPYDIDAGNMIGVLLLFVNASINIKIYIYVMLDKFFNYICGFGPLILLFSSLFLLWNKQSINAGPI